MHRKEFIQKVQEYAKIDTFGRTEKLVKIVFYALSARLTIAEGDDLEAQLSKDVREMWDDVKEKRVNVIKFKRSEFIERILQDGKLKSPEEAEKVVKAVFNALKSQVSEGEAKDVASQLPKGLKEMWSEA